MVAGAGAGDAFADAGDAFAGAVCGDEGDGGSLDDQLRLSREHGQAATMPLAPLASLPDNFGTAVGGLRTLWLDGTGMAWEQLLFLLLAPPTREAPSLSLLLLVVLLSPLSLL